MTITKRGTKGSALTYNEMDENIRDLYEDTTINRVFANGSGSGSDAQHLTYTPPADSSSPGFITVNHNTRIKMAAVDADGDSIYGQSMLDMKNHNIIGVNHLKFSDPGTNEGLEWSNIKIFEAPFDLDNTAGSLVVQHKSTGTPAGGSASTTYERRLTVSNFGTTIHGQIQSDTITPVLTLAAVDKHNTVNQTSDSGVALEFKLADNTGNGAHDVDGDGDLDGSFLGASIVARRESDTDDNSSTALEFYTSHNDETLDRRIVIDSNGNVKIGVVGTNPKPLTVRTRYGYNNAANGGIRVDTYRSELDHYTSISTVAGSNISSDCEYYGSNAFLPITTTATNIRMTSGHIIFCTNSGLTANTAFTPTERARVSSGGNLLVGTGSDEGDATNVKKVVGGVFTTLRDSLEVANGTATTVATLPSGEGNYIVSAALDNSSAPASYNEVAVVGVSQSTSTITTLKNTNAMNITMSGLNVQVYHGQGSTQTVHFSILRIL